MNRRIRVGASIALLALGTLFIAPVHGFAQTQGMENRDDRRDNRAGARSEKQDCKAGDEKTRAECRNVKRDTKQDGRQGEDAGNTNAAPAANPAP